MQVIQLAALLLVLGTTHATLTTDPVEIMTATIIEAAQQITSGMTVATGQAKRSVAKRQVGTDCLRRLTMDEFNQCQTVAHRTACQSGLQEDLYTLAEQCGQDQLARVARFSCGTNVDGLYCGQAQEIMQFYFSEAVSCYSSSSCSSTCRNGINRIRDQLGCCSGYWTQELRTQTSILSGNLWSSCGISPGPLCNNLPTFPSVSTIRSCSLSETNQILFARRCASNNTHLAIEALANTTGCGGVAIAQVDACSMDSSGSFCSLKTDVSTARLVGQNCATSVSSSSCSSACRSSLIAFRNELGCCINSLLNGTLAKISPVREVRQALPFFSNSFWSRCNVNPPGTCESTLSLPDSFTCENDAAPNGCPEITSLNGITMMSILMIALGLHIF